MGRKADFDTQAPLCGPRPLSEPGLAGMGGTFIGCHKQFDDYRWVFDAQHPIYSPVSAARTTNEAWLAFSGITERGVKE